MAKIIQWRCFLYFWTEDGAPPRPPLPSGGLDSYYGRTGSRGQPQHPPDTTDDESEDVFLNAPTPSQGPIMVSLRPRRLQLIVEQ